MEFLLGVFVIVNIALCVYVFNIAIDILSFKKMMFLIDANMFKKIEIFVLTPYNVPFNWSSRDFKIYLFFHKAYISLSLALSGLIIIYKLLHKKHEIYINLFLFISLIIISFFVFYMQSLPNIIGFVFGAIILSVSYLLKRKVIAFVVTFVTLILIGMNFETVKKQGKKIKIKIENDFRQEIWECGWELSKKHIIFGVGIGDQQQELNNCYKNKSNKTYDILKNNNYNTHNQYLSFTIAGGLICLLLFLGLIVNNINMSIDKKDVLFVVFISLILINFLFENVLDRIYGVYFFGLFNSFFIKRNVIMARTTENYE